MTGVTYEATNLDLGFTFSQESIPDSMATQKRSTNGPLIVHGVFTSAENVKEAIELGHATGFTLQSTTELGSSAVWTNRFSGTSRR